MVDDARPRVLLVDDEDDLRELVTEMLSNIGFEVQTAVHGAMALEVLQAGPTPQVIILDLNMPVMNGWDVWDWLQQSPFAHVPVVIYTATGLTNGAISTARVVSKSKPDELVSAVRSLLPA